MTGLPTRDRIAALDVLRGIAVAGILLANVLVFFGLVFIPPERAAALPHPSADHLATFLEHALVDGKFYSIFSLLFGIGFGLQLTRGGEEVLPRFRRRLKILLAIGAMHAFLIWAGDILMLYALLGFSLPWFARKPDRELPRRVVGMLAIPTALYLLALVIWLAVGAKNAALDTSSAPPGLLKLFGAVGTGGWKDALIGNLVMLAGRWADLFITVRFPKVLGMFVLGLWAVRQGIALDLAAHRALLVRWCKLGWGIGLPANLLAAWAADRWPYLPPSPGGLIGVVAQGVGVADAGDRLRDDGGAAGGERAALGAGVRAGGADGAEQLPHAVAGVRGAVARLRVRDVVAHRCGDDDADRRDHHRGAAGTERALALSLSLRAGGVGMAPADVWAADLAIGASLAGRWPCTTAPAHDI